MAKEKSKLFDKLRWMTRTALRANADKSIRWFFEKIKKKPSDFGIRSIKKSKSRLPPIGSLIHFVYDAKTKEELPYWDAFPLVMPVSWQTDTFIGINFHYLPLSYRAKLFDILRNLTSDEKKYIALSYRVLRRSVKDKIIKHCLKKYLVTHIKSDVIEVDRSEWENVLYLPTQQFRKASASKVWEDIGG